MDDKNLRTVRRYLAIDNIKMAWSMISSSGHLFLSFADQDMSLDERKKVHGDLRFILNYKKMLVENFEIIQGYHEYQFNNSKACIQLGP